MQDESGGEGHIVVAGDAESGFPSLQHVLDAIGLTCIAVSLDELLGFPEIAPPRLIVMDSAQEQAARCRQQDRLRRLPGAALAPVIVLGNETDPASVSVAVAHGASAYLAKPVSDGQLVAVARKLLSFDSAGREDERRADPRRPIFLPVELERAEGRSRNRAWVVDISRRGCRIETSDLLSTGEMVRVWLPSTEATAHLPLTGETCWADNSAGGRRQAGMHFTANASLLAILALGLDTPEGRDS